MNVRMKILRFVLSRDEKPRWGSTPEAAHALVCNGIAGPMP
jgi:hypothetical protein